MSQELLKIARKIIIMILICLTFNARENKVRGSLNFSIIYLFIHFVSSQQEDHGKNVKYCGQGYLHAVTNQAGGWWIWGVWVRWHCVFFFVPTKVGTRLIAIRGSWNTFGSTSGQQLYDSRDDTGYNGIILGKSQKFSNQSDQYLTKNKNINPT